MQNFEGNKELYEQMKIPYNSAEECSENLKNFFSEVRELRKKYKIENLSVWTNGKLIINSEENEFINGLFCGNMDREVFIAQHVLKEAHKNSFLREIEDKL